MLGRRQVDPPITVVALLDGLVGSSLIARTGDLSQRRTQPKSTNDTHALGGGVSRGGRGQGGSRWAKGGARLHSRLVG